MRSSVLLLILLVNVSGRAQTPVLKGATKPTEPVIREEILRRYAVAQAVRHKLLECVFPCEPDGLFQKLRAGDEENTFWLRGILRKYGWPGPGVVSEDGNEYALGLLMMLGNYSLEVEALPLVETAFRAGKTPGSNYAVLKDSILVSLGKPQIYGTAFLPKVNPAAKRRLVPIEDAPNVNKRRAEVGLPAIEEEPEQ